MARFCRPERLSWGNVAGHSVVMRRAPPRIRMAIPIQTAALLAREHRLRPFSGRLLQLGRQSIFFDREQCAGLCARFGLPAISADRPLDDVGWFQAIGFDAVESLDASAAENPTHVADLNEPLPARLHGQYDCVYDGGTIEHVF